MRTILLILGLTAAIFGIILVFCDKVKSLKKWKWLLSLAAAIIVVVIAVGSHIIPDRVEEIIPQVAEHECRIDSLETLIKAMTMDTAQAEELKELAREQAECIDLAGLAQTALDSAKVAIGFEKYDVALTHLNYALLGAEGDSAMIADVYFFISTANYFKENPELALQNIRQRDCLQA